jgi:hypothetical protein
VLTFWRIILLVTGRREIRREKNKMNWKKIVKKRRERCMRMKERGEESREQG